MTDPTEFDDVIAWASGPLPPEVERKARLLLLDGIACIAAGLRHAEVRALEGALGIWFPGEVTLPGAETRLGPAGAAALGAAAMCWDEANEGLATAHGRPGLPVIPAVLALSRPLPERLRALVLGYEVGARAGQLWRIRPGMHVDGSWHALGAAAACALLTGADPAEAIRLAACQIPFSLYRPIAFGMTGRNSYPAHAALLGALSAAASAAGMKAPEGSLDEARRLALLKDTPPVRAAAGAWLILDAYIKPFAAVRHAHYAAAAAIALRDRVEVSSITAIRLTTYAEALRYAGNRAPTAPISAQFSLSFAVAAGLLLGDLGPDATSHLDHPELRRLERLVELAEDPAMTERAAHMTIETPRGAVSIRIDSVPGDLGTPMSEAAIIAKFRRYAGHLPEAEAILGDLLG